MALPALLANYVNFGNGSTTGWFAVAVWPSLTAVTVGTLCRQLAAPSVGNERVFVCIIAGTTLVSEPSWTVTRGAKTAEAAGPTWQECTGQPATNGDLTNTRTWSSSKTATTSPSLGVIVKDASNNLFIVTTAGTVGASEPTWNTTVGNTTTDSTVTWTCIRNGAYGNWAAPHARLGNAGTTNWGAAGDDYYVASIHAETRAGFISNTTLGTAANPCRVLCVNASGGVPPVSADLTTGATITTTGSNSMELLTDFVYVRGFTFNCGTGAGNTNLTVGNSGIAVAQEFENCAFRVVSTGSSSRILIGANGNVGSRIRCKNCTFGFAAAGQGLSVRGLFEWWNTGSAITDTVPTTLFLGGGNESNIYLLGVDLSALGSGKNLISGTVIAQPQFYWFKDCKFGSSVTIVTGTISGPGVCEVHLTNCDSANTNYRYQRQNYEGTITQETTIVRTSGATDGTTTVSRKMATTANSKFYAPLVSDWMPFWNTTTGSAITVAIPVITDNVTLKDNEAWIEVEGLGASGFPLGTFASDAAPDVLNAGTNQTTDSTSSWTTTGLTTPVKQVLSATFTAQSMGWIRVRVCLAKASTTMYFDPAPINGSWVKYGGNAYMLGADGIVQAAAAGGVTRLAGIGGGLVA